RCCCALLRAPRPDAAMSAAQPAAPATEQRQPTAPAGSCRPAHKLPSWGPNPRLPLRRWASPSTP
ncbi:unnamed protein product, partial [Lampetra fluviatilis]